VAYPPHSCGYELSKIPFSFPHFRQDFLIASIPYAARL